MATTRIMPLHVGKGRTESRAISDIIDYVEGYVTLEKIICICYIKGTKRNNRPQGGLTSLIMK